jgi:hypothetical protein
MGLTIEDLGLLYVSLQYSILCMRTTPLGTVEANAQKEAIARREKLAAKVLEIVRTASAPPLLANSSKKRTVVSAGKPTQAL